MRYFLENFEKDFIYTWQHKKAFLGTERKLLGKNTIRGYLHDTDKLFLYLFFTKEETSKIHRKYARHHYENNLYKTNSDMIQLLIDWECNKLTKLDKPETAREYIEKAYPMEKNVFEPHLKELGL